MTNAVCVRCGAIKYGAFGYCNACGERPESEIEVAYSLALTDHYFPVETLERISTDMRNGQPRPALPREQEEQFLEAAREYLNNAGKKFGLGAKPR